MTDRANDARKRLQALHRPVPTPTPQAIAQNKAEEESRRELGRFRGFTANLHRTPESSLAVATRVGEPTLVDPKQTNAPDIVRANTASIVSASTGGTGTSNVSVEPIKGGAPPPNQPVPRSDAQPGAAAPPDNSSDTGIPELKPVTPPDSSTDAGSSSSAGSSTGSSNKPAAPPAQVNEAAGDQGNTAANAGSSSSTSTSDASSTSNDKDTTSTSKKKKKKGLGKLNPF